MKERGSERGGVPLGFLLPSYLYCTHLVLVTFVVLSVVSLEVAVEVVVFVVVLLVVVVVVELFVVVILLLVVHVLKPLQMH